MVLRVGDAEARNGESGARIDGEGCWPFHWVVECSTGRVGWSTLTPFVMWSELSCHLTLCQARCKDGDRETEKGDGRETGSSKKRGERQACKDVKGHAKVGMIRGAV